MNPSYQEFQKLAKEHSRIPVAETVVADLQTPVSAFLSIAADEPEAFLLESVENGEKMGRYTFIGVRPYMTLTAHGDKIEMKRGKKRETLRGNVFETLGKMLKAHKPAAIAGLPPFSGGAVGFVAYDMVRQLERLPSKAKNDLKVPDCILMFFDQVLAFDHIGKRIQLVVTADVSDTKPKKAYAQAVKRIGQLRRKLEEGKFDRRSGKGVSGKLKLKARTSQSEYVANVKKTKEYIAAGDAFQVVLSQRWEVTPGVEPFQIYRALRAINPSPYLYFLRMGDMHILGSSPEMLVRVTGEKIEYRPIAGTRPRGKDEAEDRSIEEHFRKDEKEIAEHVMLVDLGRNDVGRVSEFGSVQVKDLMFIERYSHVMHIVSAIEGKLRKGLSALDAFAACFPAGTLSGAPKVRAMEIIEELEPTRRGVYGGSVLYADFSGNLDSCIAIRTLLMQGKKGYIQAGAGIVADSDPVKEHEECCNKSRAVVRAIESARMG